jgi:hypothetical protein
VVGDLVAHDCVLLAVSTNRIGIQVRSAYPS